MLALGLFGAVILIFHKPYYPHQRKPYQSVWIPVDHQKQSNTHLDIDIQPTKLTEEFEKPAVDNSIVTRNIGNQPMKLTEDFKKPAVNDSIVTQNIVIEKEVANVNPNDIPTRDSRYVTSSMKLGPALKIQLNSNQSAIVEAIKHAWIGYKTYAWGADELKPVSKRGDRPSYGLGMTLIDCLDTLWLAGLQEEFDEAREWVANDLDIEHNSKSVSLFETNIRVLGGLLSAYHLSQDKLFLDKAVSVYMRCNSWFTSHIILSESNMYIRLCSLRFKVVVGCVVDSNLYKCSYLHSFLLLSHSISTVVHLSNNKCLMSVIFINYQFVFC